MLSVLIPDGPSGRPLDELHKPDLVIVTMVVGKNRRGKHACTLEAPAMSLGPSCSMSCPALSVLPCPALPHFCSWVFVPRPQPP